MALVLLLILCFLLAAAALILMFRGKFAAGTVVLILAFLLFLVFLWITEAPLF